MAYGQNNLSWPNWIGGMVTFLQSLAIKCLMELVWNTVKMGFIKAAFPTHYKLEFCNLWKLWQLARRSKEKLVFCGARITTIIHMEKRSLCPFLQWNMKSCTVFPSTPNWTKKSENKDGSWWTWRMSTIEWGFPTVTGRTVMSTEITEWVLAGAVCGPKWGIPLILLSLHPSPHITLVMF